MRHWRCVKVLPILCSAVPLVVLPYGCCLTNVAVFLHPTRGVECIVKCAGKQFQKQSVGQMHAPETPLTSHHISNLSGAPLCRLSGKQKSDPTTSGTLKRLTRHPPDR
jgi:hypothetical protein